MELHDLWLSLFDAIYCIHYIPYKSRLQGITDELDRVGILNLETFRFKNDYDTPFFDLLCKGAIKEGKLGHEGKFAKAALSHYDCIKQSYELGHERILIIENDVRFLKSLSAIQAIMSEYPRDYDIVLLDNFILNSEPEYADLRNRYIEKNKINEFFCEYKHLWSAACYGLSRKGMKHMIESQERSLRTPDMYTQFFNFADEPEGGLKRAFARKNVCIQGMCYDQTITPNDLVRERYELQGTDLDEYNIDETNESIKLTPYRDLSIPYDEALLESKGKRVMLKKFMEDNFKKRGDYLYPLKGNKNVCFHAEFDKGLLKFMAQHEITEFYPQKGGSNVPSIGFSEEEQKWYGWSHRAIYGFGIGSEVKKGHAGYEARGAWKAKTLDDAKEMAMNFADSVS